MTPRTLLQPAPFGLAILAPFLFPRRRLAFAFALPTLHGSGDLGPKDDAHLARGIAVPVRNVQVRAVFHQKVDERHVGALKREEEGHLPKPILRVHVGTLFQQQFCDFEAASGRGAGMMQRRVARDVRDLGRRARVDEVADDVEVSHGRHAWRAGSELECTQDCKGDESEQKGRLSGA